MRRIVVHKGRTIVVPVGLGFDISGDTFSSEIRVDKNRTSTLIVAWNVSFLTDGTDGELLLKLDDSATVNIPNSVGYMDIKRVSNGEPLNVLDDVIEVFFRKTVTV